MLWPTAGAVLVLLPLYSASAASLADSLALWKDHLLSQLPGEEKICRANSFSAPNSFNNNLSIQLNNSFILLEEDKHQEEIVKYNNLGKKEAGWTWYRDIVGEVLSFKNYHSEIILISYDNISYGYTHSHNSHIYNTCTLTTSLGDLTTFPVPVCTQSTSKTMAIKTETGPARPSWYNFARLALQDERIVDFLRKQRKPADPKFLMLPYLRQHIMNDGKYPYL